MTRLPPVKDSFGPAHTEQRKHESFEAQKKSNEIGCFFVIFTLNTLLKMYFFDYLVSLDYLS